MLTSDETDALAYGWELLEALEVKLGLSRHRAAVMLASVANIAALQAGSEAEELGADIAAVMFDIENALKADSQPDNVIHLKS